MCIWCWFSRRVGWGCGGGEGVGGRAEDGGGFAVGVRGGCGEAGGVGDGARHVGLVMDREDSGSDRRSALGCLEADGLIDV